MFRRIVVAGVLGLTMLGGCPTTGPEQVPDQSNADGASANGDEARTDSQDDADSGTQFKATLAGRWEVRRGDSDRVICIEIADGKVVASDEACDGSAEPLYQNSRIEPSEDEAVITWQYVVVPEVSYRHERLEVEPVEDGSFVGTAASVLTSNRTGEAISSTPAEPVCLVRPE